MYKQTEMQALLTSAKGEKPLADSLPLWQAAEVQERREARRTEKELGFFDPWPLVAPLCERVQIVTPA